MTEAGGARGLDRTARHRSLAWLTPLSAAAWAAAFFGARTGLEVVRSGTPEAVLLALLPVPFFAAFLWCFVSRLRLTDELERRIQLEALAVAFPATALLLMVLGLLELATELNPDDFSYRHVWAMLPVLYVAGLAYARGRYR